jgi:radical SAM superfamily enzyme YgiQ (UPF0313 family)
MKIALVSPFWGKMVNAYPPLGIAYIAAILEKNGHDVKLFDFSLHPDISIEEKIFNLLNFCPDLIGITSLTNTYYNSLEISKMIKSKSEIPIVMGGPHPTIFPTETLKNPYVDFVVSGEGENTIVELVNALESDKSLKDIKGLYYKIDGKIVANPPRPYIENLDELPFPARHLLELREYPLRFERGEMMTTLITSRGCPYECIYCFKELFGRRYRRRSAENIVDELKHIFSTYKIKVFYFVDDLFTFDRERVLRLCKLIIEEGLDIKWQCLARVDTVTPQLLNEMARAGCKKIHFGIESGNKQILESVNKKITLEQVRKAVEWCKAAGIKSKGYFMLGLPGDTLETMDQTIDFSLDLGLDEAMYSLTTPFPGTQLWKLLLDKEIDINFNEAFSKAYYFTDDPDRVEVFFNLSKVSDEDLKRYLGKAEKSFNEYKRKRILERKFGKMLGNIVWNTLKFFQ